MATTYTWTGKGGDGNWANAANWMVGTKVATTYPGASGATDAVVINGGTTGAIAFNVASATIGSLTVEGGDTLALGANTLTVNAGAINVGSYSPATTGAITLAGGTLSAAGSAVHLQAGAAISGAGVVDVASIGRSGGGAGGTITASGGALQVTGTIANGIQLAVDSANGGNLQLESVDVTQYAVALGNGSNVQQTLEIGANGGLTINTAENVTANGTIQLDGGAASFKDMAGLDLQSGAALTGAGVVTVGASSGTGLDGAGTVTAQGGTLTIAGSVDESTAQGSVGTSFDIGSGATLALDGSVGSAVDPTVTFAGLYSGSGILDLSADKSAVTANVDNFAKGDEILVAVNDSVTVSKTDSTEIVITNGSVTDTIELGSSVAAADAVAGYTASTGVIETAICFMGGTMIRTPDGEVAVETLKRGDRVLTADGQARPVVWLGVQTISTIFADPVRVWPVRVKAGALGDNVPCRDLVLSPDHALLVEGALIHAAALINETSIVREASVPKVFTYYHVELDDHSLILAENTPAETFVDNVDRLAFDNWAEHQALYPEGRSIDELPYPRAKSRRQVPVYVRVMLAERAAAMGAEPAAVA